MMTALSLRRESAHTEVALISYCSHVEFMRGVRAIYTQEQYEMHCKFGGYERRGQPFFRSRGQLPHMGVALVSYYFRVESMQGGGAIYTLY